MNFEINKFNQLEIHTGFAILDEQGCCPTCKSLEYSSIYMEKNSSKNPQAHTITVDSEGPNGVFYMKCDCGHVWLEKALPGHRRWRIKGFFLKSFTSKKEIK